MVAIEVAIAIFTASPGAMPRWLKISVKNGTINMPPPTPSSPAKKPVQAPSSSNSATRVGSRKPIRQARRPAGAAARTIR